MTTTNLPLGRGRVLSVDLENLGPDDVTTVARALSEPMLDALGTILRGWSPATNTAQALASRGLADSTGDLTPLGYRVWAYNLALGLEPLRPEAVVTSDRDTGMTVPVSTLYLQAAQVRAFPYGGHGRAARAQACALELERQADVLAQVSAVPVITSTSPSDVQVSACSGLGPVQVPFSGSVQDTDARAMLQADGIDVEAYAPEDAAILLSGAQYLAQTHTYGLEPITCPTVMGASVDVTYVDLPDGPYPDGLGMVLSTPSLEDATVRALALPGAIVGRRIGRGLDMGLTVTYMVLRPYVLAQVRNVWETAQDGRTVEVSDARTADTASYYPLRGDIVQVRTGDRGTTGEWSGPAVVMTHTAGRTASDRPRVPGTVSTHWSDDQGRTTGGGSSIGAQDVRPYVKALDELAGHVAQTPAGVDANDVDPGDRGSMSALDRVDVARGLKADHGHLDVSLTPYGYVHVRATAQNVEALASSVEALEDGRYRVVSRSTPSTRSLRGRVFVLAVDLAPSCRFCLEALTRADGEGVAEHAACGQSTTPDGPMCAHCGALGPITDPSVDPSGEGRCLACLAHGRTTALTDTRAELAEDPELAQVVEDLEASYAQAVASIDAQVCQRCVGTVKGCTGTTCGPILDAQAAEWKTTPDGLTSSVVGHVERSCAYWEAYGLPKLPHVCDMGPLALEHLGAAQSATAQDMEDLEADYPSDDGEDHGALTVTLDVQHGRAILSLSLEGYGFPCPTCDAYGPDESCTAVEGVDDLEPGTLTDDHADRGAVPMPADSPMCAGPCEDDEPRLCVAGCGTEIGDHETVCGDCVPDAQDDDHAENVQVDDQGRRFIILEPNWPGMRAYCRAVQVHDVEHATRLATAMGSEGVPYVDGLDVRDGLPSLVVKLDGQGLPSGVERGIVQVAQGLDILPGRRVTVSVRSGALKLCADDMRTPYGMGPVLDALRAHVEAPARAAMADQGHDMGPTDDGATTCAQCHDPAMSSDLAAFYRDGQADHLGTLGHTCRGPLSAAMEAFKRATVDLAQVWADDDSHADILGQSYGLPMSFDELAAIVADWPTI